MIIISYCEQYEVYYRGSWSAGGDARLTVQWCDTISDIVKHISDFLYRDTNPDAPYANLVFTSWEAMRNCSVDLDNYTGNSGDAFQSVTVIGEPGRESEADAVCAEVRRLVAVRLDTLKQDAQTKAQAEKERREVEEKARQEKEKEETALRDYKRLWAKFGGSDPGV